MKRKNLIATKKVKNNISLFKNPKILNFYSKFKSKIFKDIGNKDFALAVSGGSDSLCLAYFGKIYSLEFGNKIHILIIDHQLRKESLNEALKVKQILSKRKIPSKILSWKGKSPKSNIQKKARDIRYSLLSNYCLKNNIKYLITAHHGDDQIENFFIRLLRGSGLTGLSSMATKTKYNNHLKIIRPFLNLNKEDLKYVTLNYFKTYIKDPSNYDDKFLRVRIRKYKKSMEKEGLDTKKIFKTVENLVSANQALNFYKNKALYKHASFVSKDKCLLNKKIFLEEAREIIFKSFSDILSLVSGTYYPPRSKKVINLIERLNLPLDSSKIILLFSLFCFAVFLLITRRPSMRRAIVALVVCLLVANSFVTYTRATVWETRTSLLFFAVRNHPDSYRAHMGYGAALQAESQDIYITYSEYQKSGLLNKYNVLPVVRMQRIISGALNQLEEGSLSEEPAPEPASGLELFYSPLILNRMYLERLDELVKEEIPHRLSDYALDAETSVAIAELQRCIVAEYLTCPPMSRFESWLTLILEREDLTPTQRMSFLQLAARIDAYKGNLDASVASLEEALELTENNAPILIEIANTKFKLGEWESAWEMLDDVEQVVDSTGQGLRHFRELKALILEAKEEAQAAQQSSGDALQH